MSSIKLTDSQTTLKPSSPSVLVPPSNAKPRRVRTSRHEAWIPSLHLLNTDKKIVSSESQWLNDSIINAAQQLLSESGAMIQGFQNTLLGKGQKFKALKSDGAPFVQILHVNSNHWITTTNINCEAGEVRVFDSLYKYISLDIKKQVCSFLRPSAFEISHHKHHGYAETT